MSKQHVSRGNIFVKSGSSGIYLYTHNNGRQLPQILKNALLRGKSRWGNTPVMTRIIFGEMVQNDILNNDGFGISTELADNDFLLLIVDDSNQRVGVFGEGGECYITYPYETYATLTENKLKWEQIANGFTMERNDYMSIPRDPAMGELYPFPNSTDDYSQKSFFSVAKDYWTTTDEAPARLFGHVNIATPPTHVTLTPVLPDPHAQAPDPDAELERRLDDTTRQLEAMFGRGRLLNVPPELTPNPVTLDTEGAWRDLGRVPGPTVEPNPTQERDEIMWEATPTPDDNEPNR
jgi:hypothetical protein